MTVELIANSPTPGSSTPIATLATAVITTPVAGTIETWTFSSAPPAALQAAGQYRFTIDSEICIDVTGGGGASRQIQRGAEGSSVATHLQGAGIYHGITAAGLANWLATNLPASVALVSAANVFTAAQTINATGGSAFQVKDGSGNQVIRSGNIETGGKVAGAWLVFGTNAPGAGSGFGAWNFGVDTAAATPDRDWFHSKVLSTGAISDPDGIYISNGGASPASVGIGMAQPLDNTTNHFRAVVQAPGTAGGDTSYGGMLVQFASGQTGDTLALGSSNNAVANHRFKSDGTIQLAASPQANKTAADGATNSNTTVTSATIGFTADDQGKFIAGTGLPNGTYIASVQSATSVTINQAATATATGVSLTVYGRAFQLTTNGSAPWLTVTNGSGGGAALITTGLVGLGPGAPAVPTATVDAVASTGNNATFKVRTQSGGAFQVLANNGTPFDVTIGTTGSSALRLGTNSPTIALAITTTQDVIVGPGSKAAPAELAQNATTGFFSIPTVPTGAPTGTPAASAIPTGATPIVYDRVEDKLYVWSKQQTKWVGVALA